MGRKDDFDRHFQPLPAQPLDLVGHPAAIAPQIALIPCVVDFFFPQMSERYRFDKGTHIQRCPASLGQRDCTQHGWRLVQGLIGDQQ
ncbi:hypothetical protein D3C71_2054050 [compost metagenome]